MEVRTNRSEALAVNQIASNIFDITISGIEPVEQPILIYFQTNRSITNPLCSFLVEDTSVCSQLGLELTESTQNRTVCETKRLTTITVLAGSRARHSDTEPLVLKILTYVLLIISLIFLLFSL